MTTLTNAIRTIEEKPMDNTALLLTQYEKYGTIGKDEYIQFYIDEELEIDENLIGDYNEYLIENGYECYYSDLEEMTYGMSTMDVVRATFYGHDFNPYRDYFQFNGYGNIDGFEAYQVLREMKNDYDFLEWYINENDLIDWDEAQPHIDEANELIRKGY